MQSGPLYDDVLLDHYAHPRNKHTVEDAGATGRGAIAMCGDDLLVSLRLAGESVADIGWSGHACSIGEASASMMTEAVKSRDTAEIRRWIQTVRATVSGSAKEIDPLIVLGDLSSLKGVRLYPARVKCALLPWDALDAALTTLEGGR